MSWSARGIVTYLLAKPDDWEIRAEDIRKRGDLGRDAVYAMLKELRRYGYLGRTPGRDKRGRFGTVDSTLYEVPIPDLPDTVAPDPGEPYPANPTLLSNKYTKEPVNQITTTTTTAAPNPERGPRGGCNLEFPKSLSSGETEEARRRLDGFSNRLAQQLLDELSARLQAGAIHGSPLAYLRGLIKRACRGEFTPEAGVPVADTRVRIRRTDAARVQGQLTVPRLPEPDPDNPLVQRFEAIRARVNGSSPDSSAQPDVRSTESRCSLD